MPEIQPTPGAKMLYLIKRKPTTSREELVAHWFANHMPQVIAGQSAQRAIGKLHAWRYIATLFDPELTGEHTWDGLAQLWWDRDLPKPKQPFGDPPRDTFQEKTEPYSPWATREYVVVDGGDRLSTEPLTLNAPYPMTRSGFFKVTFLVVAKPATDYDAFFSHWLHTHVPNVTAVLKDAGGFRYVVSHSIHPEAEPYAGMAELYFPSKTEWQAYKVAIKPDGMEKWAADEGTLVLRASTEMVGIP